MGSFEGHALPGAFFIALSAWWFVNILLLFIRDACKRKDHQPGDEPSREFSTWFHVQVGCLRKVPLEPLLMVLLATIGMILELNIDDDNHWVLYRRITNDQGDFEHSNLNNFAHATMYGAFVLTAWIEILRFYKLLHLPKSSQYVAMSLAFFIEGILFYFHLDGRPVLHQRMHILLYLVIFAIASVLILEAWHNNSLTLLVVRAFLTMLQGTWFVQVGYSLHGRNPWKDTEGSREIVTVVFALHIMGLLFLLLVCCLFASICTRVYSRRIEVIDIKDEALEANNEMACLLG